MRLYVLLYDSGRKFNDVVDVFKTYTDANHIREMSDNPQDYKIIYTEIDLLSLVKGGVK